MRTFSQFAITACILACTTVIAQQKAGNGKAIQLKISGIDASRFPKVSVTFKAEDKNGVPFWNLNKASISENNCAVEMGQMHQIGKSKPIYVSIVVDHSASMEDDPSQLYDKAGKPRFTIDAEDNMVVPEDYVMPIENAKEGIKQFITAFDSQKDYISITGFGTSVDKPIAITSDEAKLLAYTDGIEATGKTALYDGLITGLEQLKNSGGPKFMVALTDGQDNTSKSTIEDVIQLAKREGIPIYLIGLGEASKQKLQQIAKETNGDFFFANSSLSLQSIYSTISRMMQSMYELEYISGNTDPKLKTREIVLSGEADRVIVQQDKSSFLVPDISSVVIVNHKSVSVSSHEVLLQKKAYQPPMSKVAFAKGPVETPKVQSFPPGFENLTSWIYFNHLILLIGGIFIIILFRTILKKLTTGS